MQDENKRLLELAAKAAGMRTKHTPGPWKYAGRNSIGCGGLLNGPNGELIAVMYSSRVNRNSDYDARLIAAAPELLEALTEVLRVNETDAGNDVKARANAMLNAHAAIAKATGEKTP